jgi:hypothetical protein
MFVFGGLLRKYLGYLIIIDLEFEGIYPNIYIIYI